MYILPIVIFFARYGNIPSSVGLLVSVQWIHNDFLADTDFTVNI